MYKQKHILAQTRSKKIEEYINQAVNSKIRNKHSQLLYFTEWLFNDLDFRGKNVLDIGNGSGYFSFLISELGANLVVGIEPRLEGSKEEVHHLFEEFKTKYNYFNVTQMNTTLQDYNSREKFDIILLIDSINHLDEEIVSKLHLKGAKEERRCFYELTKKIADLLKPGGILLITDCSRKNFWNSVHLKNPFMGQIEWEKHQSPYFWQSLFKEHCMRFAQIGWSHPYLKGLGKLLLSNKIASYFLISHFRLIMKKT